MFSIYVWNYKEKKIFSAHIEAKWQEHESNFHCAEKTPQSTIWRILISVHWVVVNVTISKNGDKKLPLLTDFLKTAYCNLSKFRSLEDRAVLIVRYLINGHYFVSQLRSG